MSEADFKIAHVDPRVRTPPPRAYLSTLVPGNTFGVQLPADRMHAPAPETTALDQVHKEGPNLPTADTDENADEAGRFARWLEKKEMEQDNKYNRTVTISPLPDDATVADVLPRIRGGVESCYVSQFEQTRVAVVTFKLAADAITYADFCKETPIWGLWTFEISRPGVPFTWERRAKVERYKSAPEMGSVRGEIPTEPRTVVLAGSRCLVYKGCKPHEVAGIYRALGLQKSQHQRDQVEGMWLEGPVRDQNGYPVRGNLHVWYTSIKAAQEARVRVTSLEFEYDPCSDSPDKLLLYLDEGDDVPIFRHHDPFVNLIELDQKSIMTGVYEGLVDPVQAYWRCGAGARPAVPDPMADLTTRLQWSLQTNNGPPMMSTMPGAYQHSDMVLPPAALSDPFLDTQPIATALRAQQYNRATTSYTPGPAGQNIPTEYQPFAASREVPPGHHLSPIETYVARRQERQAVGIPPNYSTNKNHVVYRQIQPTSSLAGRANITNNDIGGIGNSARRSSNTDTTNNYSNLGGVNNNPQSGRQPRSGFYDS